VGKKMKIKIDYVKNGLWIDEPDRNLVKILSMKDSKPIQYPMTNIKKSLESPIASPSLAELARGKNLPAL
jgi:nickel-dependent lactate racemase